jgi:large subunit ribosomal protein L17
MPWQRKLGRPTDQRTSILRGLSTALILNGHIETTEARAKEVKRIVEKLITDAVKQKDAFTTKTVTVSHAKLDSKGRKVLKGKTSKNGAKYDVVERETKTEIVQVDLPARLAVRRRAIRWLAKSHDAEGKALNPVDKLFDEIAVKYAGRAGGYTRIVKLGARRGDATEMALLELV